MPDLIEIPCAMHRKSHNLTPREAAVVIVTLFGMARDLADDPEGSIAEHDECVREILDLGKDGEGYYEHVTSILGNDAIDYPDLAEMAARDDAARANAAARRASLFSPKWDPEGGAL